MSSEYDLKVEVASRLTLMCAADASLKTFILNSRVLVNPQLAKTHAECMPVHYGNTSGFEVDMLGIINGLVGEHKYNIVPQFEDERLIGFKVVDSDNQLSVNSIKQIEESE